MKVVGCSNIRHLPTLLKAIVVQKRQMQQMRGFEMKPLQQMLSGLFKEIAALCFISSMQSAVEDSLLKKYMRCCSTLEIFWKYIGHIFEIYWTNFAGILNICGIHIGDVATLWACQ